MIEPLASAYRATLQERTTTHMAFPTAVNSQVTDAVTKPKAKAKKTATAKKTKKTPKKK